MAQHCVAFQPEYRLLHTLCQKLAEVSWLSKQRSQQQARTPLICSSGSGRRPLLQAMPRVSQYRHVKMPLEKGGPPKLFFPLRAVGLAVEKAYKLDRDTGTVAKEGLKHVDLSGGGLQILDNREFRKVRACTLELQQEDAQLARKIYLAQRQWLLDMRANVWYTDENFPSGCGVQGAFDLICSVTEGQKIGIDGRLWVELKVFGAKSCMRNMGKAEGVLKAGLEKVRRKDKTFGAVLLLVASVEDSKYKLLGRLLTVGSEKFKDLTPTGLCVAMGQKRITQKPPLASIWPQIEWHWLSQTREVGLVSHFLDAMGLPNDSVGRRKDAFNELLSLNQAPGRIVAERIPNRPGPALWVCTREEFRVLHRCL